MDQTIRVVGIVGAGTMGRGIAQVCLLAGLEVVVVDVSDIAVGGMREGIGASLDKLIAKERIGVADKAGALARLNASTEFSALSGAELVIEAATERLDLKLAILSRLGELLAPQALIATNTSSLSITRLATAVRHPERFVGMHFFNPVPVMPLVEIIASDVTDAAVLARIERLCCLLGKSAVVAKNSPGFVVNRILCPMINEAFCVLGEGVASAEAIDLAMTLGSKQPLGPLALGDLIGLDTLLAIMEVLHTELADPKYRPAQLLRELVKAGKLGRKTGQGIYCYPSVAG